MQQTTATFGRRGVPSAPKASSKTWGPVAAGRPAAAPAAPVAPPAARFAAESHGVLWLFTSYHGRIRRMTFWLGWIGLEVVWLISQGVIHKLFPAYSAFAFLRADPRAADDLMAPMMINGVIASAFLFSLFALYVKRTHDRNKSGWFALLTIVPILNLWPLIEFRFLESKPGPNRFSPPIIDDEVFS